MTREEKEEAIEELEQMIKWGDPYEINADACKVAIKVLKQEQCEDSISRQAMHIELEKWITYGEYKYSNATKYLYDRIDRLPSVNPQEPKTGYWIDADSYNAICSCCNRLNHLYGTYCKHCGAKMIDPQKGEE